MQEFHKNNLDPWMWEIVNEFPQLYLPPSPTVKHYINKGYLKSGETVNLRYGFECGEGWKEILKEWSQAAIDFSSLVWKSGEEPTFAIYPCIIKEKFGTLTCQSDLEIKDEKLWKMWYNIQGSIERKSGYTCEICGKYGEKNNSGWIRTLCQECKNRVVA